MEQTHPRILFVPVSATTGLGEYSRCLTIAQGAIARWPDARIAFIVNREAPYARQVPFESYLVDGSPTMNTEAVNAFVRRDPPDVVIFDNTARVRQLECAKRVGARTVFISERPKNRRRAFRPGRLRRLDEHWIIVRAAPTMSLGWTERLLLRVFRQTRVLFAHGIFPEPNKTRREQLKQQVSLPDGSYVLFAPGGGGWQWRGRRVSGLYAQATGTVAAETQMPTVVVMGPLYADRVPDIQGVIALPSESNAHMADLVHDAHAVVLGGGGMVSQALAHGRVCIAAPAGGKDQRRRIRRLAHLDAVAASPLDPEALAQTTISVLHDRDRYHTIQARAQALGIRNGLPHILDALGTLIGKQ